jgi:hypothetical protein
MTSLCHAAQIVGAWCLIPYTLQPTKIARSREFVRDYRRCDKMDTHAPLTQLLRLVFSPRGRICRSTYWIASIAPGVVFVAAFIALESLFGRGSTLIMYPPLFWAALVLTVRRSHGRTKSPLGLLLLLIPVLGALW